MELIIKSHTQIHVTSFFHPNSVYIGYLPRPSSFLLNLQWTQMQNSIGMCEGIPKKNGATGLPQYRT